MLGLSAIHCEGPTFSMRWQAAKVNCPQPAARFNAVIEGTMTNAATIVDKLLNSIKSFSYKRKEPEVQPFKPLIETWGDKRIDLPATTLPVL